MSEFDHRILALLKKKRERPEWEFEPGPLQCRCSALPVELSSQLGAGRYVDRIHSVVTQLPAVLTRKRG